MKKLLTITLVFCIALAANAQKSRQNTLEKSQHADKLRKVLGVTKDYIITYNAPKSFMPSRMKVDLVAYDRQTEVEAFRIPLYGTGKRGYALRKLIMMEVIVQNSQIMILYKEKTTPNQAHVKGFYAEILSQKLEEIMAVKEIVNTVEHLPKLYPFKSNRMIDSEVVFNDNRAAILFEMHDVRTMQVTVVTNVFDMNAENVEESVFQPNLNFGRTSITQAYSLMGAYEMTSEGNILVKYRIKGGVKKGRKERKKYQYMVGHFNLSTENIAQMTLADDVISFDDLKFAQKEGNVLCVGLYDNLQNEVGVLSNGVFVVPFDISKGLQGADVKFIDFSTKELDQLFDLSDEGFDVSRKELLQNDYRTLMLLDQLEVLEDGSIVLVASGLFNQTNNGGNYPYPESVKLNLYVFKLNSSMEMQWVNVLPRFVSLMGHYQKDVKAITDDDRMFIYFSQNARYTKDNDFYPMGVLNLNSGDFDFEDSEISKDQLKTKSYSQFHPNVRFDVIEGKVYGCNPLGYSRGQL